MDSFTDNGQSIPFREPNFKVRNRLRAEQGKWFTANDASWELFAFKEHHPSVGFDRNGRNSPEDKGNWILARPGAVVSYGEVDFGSKPPKYMEIRIAVGRENAGGRIALVDVSGDFTPDRTLAELTTEYTGGWFTWKTFRVPMQPVTGKRTVLFRFDGKDCNLRSWRPVW